MKNKRKNDISDNSESDKNENVPSPVKTALGSEKSSKSKNSSKKKSASDSNNWSDDKNELQTTQPKLEALENEFRNEKTSEKTTHLEFREKHSSNTSYNTIKSIFTIEELTSDDEIYTVQCPEDYIKQNLCNKISIDFIKSKQAITHNKEMFLLEVLNCEKKFITLAVPKKISGGSLIKMPLKGHIVLQKVVENLPDKSKSDFNDEDAVFDEHRVIFPDNIKVRHPLLGAEWKAQIDIANEAIRGKYSIKKNNKTKKSKSLKTQAADTQNYERENINSQVIVQKKKRKKSDA